jgi:hypothetical protein
MLWQFLGVLADRLDQTGAAWADEPKTLKEPRIMMESGEVTDVIDAFDDGDLFDLNVSLGFGYSAKTATIRRETSVNQAGLTSGGFTSNLENVANYAENTSRLVPRIDIGIYKDLAFHLALPIVLQNTRSLTGLNGSDQNQAVVLEGAPGEQLFSLPFNSPSRSGLDTINVGLDLDILAQHRDRTKPTWLFGIESRFSVGPAMHACNANPTGNELQCAQPNDYTRTGQLSSNPAIANAEGGAGANLSPRSPGVSRGTIALEAHTYLSKRIKYVEPYGGFAALVEFQQDGSSDYGLTDLPGSLVNMPPLVGTLTAGIMIIPWENREKFGRLTFDLRAQGEYHSEGRDYSELFDALGSSDAPSLRQPQWAQYKSNPSCINNAPNCPSSIIDPGSQTTYTTGLSDVAAYGSYRGSASVIWQASEYVKFQFGLGYRHDQAHDITGDQPCNPSNKSDPGAAGPCHTGGTNATSFTVTGIPNPNYRATINEVGRRFWVDDSNTFDLFASGVLMF